MDKWEKSLNKWVSLGFINPDQAKQIRQYELTHGKSSWFLTGLLTLGVIVISIGVISFVAANWHEITDGTKLLADFFILFMLGAVIFYSYQHKKIVLYEMFTLFFIVFCLASIGLISQIYHTGGELYEALMLWAVITAPLMLMTSYMVVPFIWMAGFLFGVVNTALFSPLWQPIYHENFQAIVVTLPYFCFLLAFICDKLLRKSGAYKAFILWGFMTGFLALVVTEFFAYDENVKLNPSAYWIPDILALFCLVALIFNNAYNKIQKSILMSALLAFFLFSHLPLLAIESIVIYAVLTLLILSLFTVLMASFRYRVWFQWFLFFMGARFLILYFQALGGLARTGGGLIISGLIIILLTLLWGKYRNKLAKWAERWTQ